MLKPSLSHSLIKKIESVNSSDMNDLIAIEEPLEIRIGFGSKESRQQKSISVTMRTPGNDFELALGFLFTEGIITNKNDIAQIKYCTEVNTIENQENIVRAELKENIEVEFKKLERNFYTTSSCGVCGKASIDAIKIVCQTKVDSRQLTVERELIFSLPDKLRAQQSVFEYTGGIHASALFDLEGNLLLLREDVGRHNALDKLIGAALGSFSTPLELTIPIDKHILLLSGRASFELIQKAAMAGVRIVCAIGAPSSLAIETANDFGITLIGFLRDNKFNIYSNPDRII
jgi:FdhD protein